MKQFLKYPSIAEAARLANIEKQNLVKMLKGRQRPTVDMCARFSKAWQEDIVTVLKIFYPEYFTDARLTDDK